MALDAQTFRVICNDVGHTVRKYSPVRTGNLRQAVTLQYLENAAVIYVNLDKAPYMPYTNEPWVSPKWRGKQNPNQYWFDNAVDHIIEEIAGRYGGKIERVFEGTFVDFNLLAMQYNVQNHQILMHSDFKTHTFGRMSTWHY